MSSYTKEHCVICNNAEDNKYFAAREMMYGMEGDFTYMECSKCNCVQLLNIPDNLGMYYPSDYGPHRKKGRVKSFLIDYMYMKRMDYYLTKKGLIGRLFSKKFPYELANIIADNIPKHDKRMRILDVGCGNGYILISLKNLGFTNLTGVDLFAPEMEYGRYDGIKFISGTVHDIVGGGGIFDVIIMNNSLEHMADQHEVISKIGQLLSKDGVLIVALPIADSYLYREYRENWYALDPPRHIVIHTRKSLAMLTEEANLYLFDFKLEENTGSFIISELRRNGIYGTELTEKTVSEYNEKHAEYVRDISDKIIKTSSADTACFIYKKRAAK